MKALPPQHWRFLQEWMTNGQNITQAALAVGWAESSAARHGRRLISQWRKQGVIPALAEKVANKAQLDAARVLGQVARVVEFDVGRLYREDGSLIPPHQLDEETRACVQSVLHRSDGSIEIKISDRLEAAKLAMKHLGLFKEDNRQKFQGLSVEVKFVDTDKRPGDDAKPVRAETVAIEPPNGG